ncbi:ABC transporter ATP-binding protein [Streptomyces sp. NPDC050164]|uniref:ABC transporter ATP-binding protein n=1 Tax=Streptomyces sp. NPDC050164 TaxID=3365605 RepID=UPI0037ADA594
MTPSTQRRETRGSDVPGASGTQDAPETTATLNTPGTPTTPIRRLLHCCRRYPRTIALTAAATVAAIVAAVAVPLVSRAIVDRVILADELPLLPCLLVLLLAGLARFGAGAAQRCLAARLSCDVQHDLRMRTFTALSRLDGAGQDALQTGQVVSRSIYDLAMAQGLLAMLPTILGSVLLLVLSLVIMLALSPLLTLVMLLVLPLLLYTAWHSSRRLYPATLEARQREAAVASVVDDAVAGVRVVKGFGQEDRELRRLGAVANALFTARQRVVRLNALYGSTLQALPLLGQVGILATGGWMASRGAISLGTFVAFSTYVAQIVAPLRGLATVVTSFHQARASVVRVFELIDTRPGVTDRPDARRLPPGPLGIELSDVTFAYEGDEAQHRGDLGGQGDHGRQGDRENGKGHAYTRPVLNGLSLTVRPGETLALVGAPGSGKSTVTLLLSRFYDVRGGAVHVGDRDVRDLALDSLRSAIGLVPETSFLFYGTVRDNIAYGLPEATEAQITAAATAAGADGFIRELPQGYDTTVGERGFTLSGGQRQRVALARALITDPRVLLLDDATSAVDPRTEEAIHGTLRQVMWGRTTLLVARRRSTLQLADRIALLEDGRVTETGTHDDLMARSAAYRNLFASTAADPDTEGAGRGDAAAHATSSYEESYALDTDPARTARAVPEPDSAAPPQLAALAPTATAPAPEAEPGFDLRGLLRPFRRALVLGAVFVLLDALVSVFVPLLIRTGIDDGIQQAASSVVVVTSVAAVAVVFVGWAVSMAQIRTNGLLGERLRYVLRLRGFAHLQRLDLAYYERELSGRIMTRMTADVESVAAFAQTGFATAAVSLISTLSVLIVLLVLDWRLGLVVCAGLPVLAAATALFRWASAGAYGAARDTSGAVNTELQEYVAGLRIAQAFRQTARGAERFAGMSAAYRTARLRAQRHAAGYFGFVELLPGATAACVLAFGADRARDGGLTMGLLVVFLLYVDVLFSSVLQLSQVFDGYQQASVGLSRILDLFGTPSGTPRASQPLPVSRLKGAIEFEDVRFRYPGATRDAVDGVRLSIPAGQTVALVGETGAGKSTLVKLVGRFYDVTAGAVRVDGYDLRTLELADYRRRLGVVPQETHLSGGTVYDAIAYGRPGAAESEVEAAARAVGAHELLSRLPGGYRHPVGEGGRTLSAGQRQLIALVRAQLISPDVLLLDEATSVLDPGTEAAVSGAVARLTEDRTSLIVAHRLTTAARADHIVVLAAGAIAEEGTHTDLLARNGPYARLWRCYGHDSDSSESVVAGGRDGCGLG